MLARMLKARLKQDQGQFAIKGRGTKAAIQFVLEALVKQKWRWIVTADIRNAYPSATEWAMKTLPIPYIAMEWTYGLGWKSDPGLLQGASASSPALAMILQPVLENLPTTARTALYVDDFIAVCPSKAAAEEVVHALKQGLAMCPGDFHLKCLNVLHAKDGFSYLGYEIQVAKNGKVTTHISDTAWVRLNNRCEELALKGYSIKELHRYVNDWRQSFPLAKLRSEDKLWLKLLPGEAWLTINQELAKSLEEKYLLAVLHAAIGYKPA